MGVTLNIALRPFFIFKGFDMIKINFKCDCLKEEFTKGNIRLYMCTKRGSFFYSISDHCYDCPKYQEMLDQVCKILED